MAGVVGEAGDGCAEAVIAGPAEDDAAALAGGDGDGSDAGLGGELLGGGEALADVAELGKDLGGADAPGAWEGHDDAAVGELSDGVLDAPVSVASWLDQGLQDGDQGADELAFGFRFGWRGQAAGAACRRASNSAGGAPAAVGMLGAGRRPSASRRAGAALSGVGIALKEGQGDRRVDIGEDGGGAGPEAVEQGAQAVGEGDALGDQIVAGADQRAQSLDRRPSEGWRGRKR